MKVEQVEYAAGFCVPRHLHDTANLIYIIDGAHWSGHSRGGDACLPRTVRFLPAGEPHENYFPVGSHCLHVELDDALLLLAREDGVTLHMPGEVACASAMALGEQLRREFAQRDDLTALAVEGILLQLVLSGVRQSAPRREPIPAWLRGVREVLHEKSGSHLSLAELALCSGRHPVQVSRQFHHHFGCTISAYVRQVRVARAQELLLTPELSVADIALASGFFDQSHFTNAFRRVTGVPPHRYRRQNRGRVAK